MNYTVIIYHGDKIDIHRKVTDTAARAISKDARCHGAKVQIIGKRVSNLEVSK